MPQEKAMVGSLKHRPEKDLHTEPQRGGISKQSPRPTWSSGTGTKGPAGKGNVRGFAYARWVERESQIKLMLGAVTTAIV